MAKDLKASLDRDRERLATLQAQITAKQARLVIANRQLDTRRKVLLGAYILDSLAKSPDGPVASTFRQHLIDFRGFIGERNEPVFEDLLLAT